MRVFLTLLVVAGAAVAVFAPAAPADTTTTLSVCGPVPAPPCVVSVKRNGLVIPYDAAPGGADDVVYATKFHITGDPTKRFYFNIAAPDGSWTLDVSDTYEISLNLGTADPGETFERGRDVTITRDLSDPGNQIVTFTQNPVLVADQGCNSMGSCDPVAGRTLTGYADGWIDDLAYITDPDDRAGMRGYDFATSADWSSSPPTLNYDTHTFILDIGNAHFLADGTTPFVGSAEFRFPFRDAEPSLRSRRSRFAHCGLVHDQWNRCSGHDHRGHRFRRSRRACDHRRHDVLQAPAEDHRRHAARRGAEPKSDSGKRHRRQAQVRPGEVAGLQGPRL
jgi:hypothetical protein